MNLCRKQTYGYQGVMGGETQRLGLRISCTSTIYKIGNLKGTYSTVQGTLLNTQ